MDEPFKTKVDKKSSGEFRKSLGSLLRTAGMLAALVLVAGIVILWLGKNVDQHNQVVTWVLNAADYVDGPFSRDGGLFTFSGGDADIRNAAVNWGIGAIAYILAGRYLRRLLTL